MHKLMPYRPSNQLSQITILDPLPSASASNFCEGGVLACSLLIRLKVSVSTDVTHRYYHLLPYSRCRRSTPQSNERSHKSTLSRPTSFISAKVA
eukprot:scaffold16194_cov52-Cyclotella_meneghiniana.AAC.8